MPFQYTQLAESATQFVLIAWNVLELPISLNRESAYECISKLTIFDENLSGLSFYDLISCSVYFL